jgi:hypothetical protein
MQVEAQRVPHTPPTPHHRGSNTYPRTPDAASDRRPQRRARTLGGPKQERDISSQLTERMSCWPCTPLATSSRSSKSDFRDSQFLLNNARFPMSFPGTGALRVRMQTYRRSLRGRIAHPRRSRGPAPLGGPDSRHDRATSATVLKLTAWLLSTSQRRRAITGAESNFDKVIDIMTR